MDFVINYSNSYFVNQEEFLKNIPQEKQSSLTKRKVTYIGCIHLI